MDGTWVRDLTPTEREEDSLYHTYMAGGEGVLTAWVGGGNVLTVWATKGHMEELHSFNVINFRCDHGGRSWIGEVQVIDQSKIALLLKRCKGSLVFLKRGEQVWEEKIVACFPLLGFGFIR